MNNRRGKTIGWGIKPTIAIFTLTLFARFGLAQIGTPAPDAGALLAGEHSPLIFSGSGLIRGAAHPCTTGWTLIGAAASASDEENKIISRFNPERFTLALKLACWGEGDSAVVTQARFEVQHDTTAAPVWNGDSTNLFIQVNAQSHPQYGEWVFAPPSDTSHGWTFPLRLWHGGWLRFVFASNTADTAAVNWSLICEH